MHKSHLIAQALVVIIVSLALFKMKKGLTFWKSIKSTDENLKSLVCVK